MSLDGMDEEPAFQSKGSPGALSHAPGGQLLLVRDPHYVTARRRPRVAVKLAAEALSRLRSAGTARGRGADPSEAR